MPRALTEEKFARMRCRHVPDEYLDKEYGRAAQSRAPETNHDIAVVLKEYSVKLPTRKTSGFGDS